MAAASHDTGFTAYVVELLAPLGRVVSRRMFGAHGIYQDGLMFALIDGDVLYFKTDAVTQPQFEQAGCEPFVYEGKGRRVTLSYWRAPDEAMESPALIQPWGRLAIEAALRKANAAVKSPRSTRARKDAASMQKPAGGKRPAASKPAKRVIKRSTKPRS